MSPIPAYLAAAPAVARPHLAEMYTLLQRLLPTAEERISYGMPAFWQGRVLVYFGAAKHHLGFYPTSAPLVALRAELGAYHTSKGAIQFPYDRPLPTELITRLVAQRLTALKVAQSPDRRRG